MKDLADSTVVDGHLSFVYMRSAFHDVSCLSNCICGEDVLTPQTLQCIKVMQVIAILT